jgi:hypothetical protein
VAVADIELPEQPGNVPRYDLGIVRVTGLICPSWSSAEVGLDLDYVVGCGRTGQVHYDYTQDDGYFDCWACGIWFRPETPPPGFVPVDELDEG